VTKKNEDRTHAALLFGLANATYQAVILGRVSDGVTVVEYYSPPVWRERKGWEEQRLRRGTASSKKIKSIVEKVCRQGGRTVNCYRETRLGVVPTVPSSGPVRGLKNRVQQLGLCDQGGGRRSCRIRHRYGLLRPTDACERTMHHEKFHLRELVYKRSGLEPKAAAQNAT